MIQISLVIKLVMAQQVLLIQISLGLLLVMKQQMQVFKFHWSYAGQNASGAGQSNFIGYYAGYSAINVYSNFIGYYWL
jgi:hypothetical protein